MTHNNLLQHAIHASLLAGVEIMKVYISDDFEVTTKHDLSPVTRADIAASNIIIAQLQATNIPIICEENAEVPYEERKTWNRVY